MNSLKTKFLFFAFIVALFFTACEEKPVVIPEFTIQETGRVVLVEELTGVKCPNCPAGSARLKEAQTLAPDNVVIVAVHGIDLAEPLEQSLFDFRNEDAADLENFLKPFLGKPAAYFNRNQFEDLNGDWGHSFNGQWISLVAEELERPQVMNLSIIKEYDVQNRQINIKVSALPLEDLLGEFKMTIMLTESKIIDAQDDQRSIIEDYEHNFVLREIITNFDGDFVSNDLPANELLTRDYTFTVPEDVEWELDNLAIVAFIANTEGESEEILQAAETSLLD